MNTGDSSKPSNGPELVKACQAFSDFLETVAALRHPQTGCPWDLEQDHRSLARFMIEEAYEASEQMTSGKEGSELCGELGDVLLQVVLNSQVALDEGRFSIIEVIQSINAKMQRRHPHVFGNSEQRSKRDIDSIKKSWIEIKEQENLKPSGESHGGQALSGETDPLGSRDIPGLEIEYEKGIFQKGKVDKVFPAALKAHKIGEIARRIQFDWSNPLEVLDKLESEIVELKQALLQSRDIGLSSSVLDEIGDVYFSLNQLARHLGTNGEAAAEHGNQKFLTRFMALEDLAKQQGLSLDKCTPVMLEELWRQAKITGSLP